MKAKCSNCNGKGIVAGFKKSDIWQKCHDCNGTGYGDNVWKVLQLQTLPGGKSFAWSEVIGGGFHAVTEQKAMELAKWIYGPYISIAKAS